MAASAYLICSRLYNDYDGIQHDYTKKQGLVWQEVFLPEYAPQEWQDREKLWNAVEEVETAKDSCLAREFVVALPIELSREEQIELLQEFIREQFVSDGMCADAAIHDTDGHNPHAHILLTVRPLDEQGKWQYKTEKEYLCMKNGEERGFTAVEFKAAQNKGWEKQLNGFFVEAFFLLPELFALEMSGNANPSRSKGSYRSSQDEHACHHSSANDSPCRCKTRSDTSRR